MEALQRSLTNAMARQLLINPFNSWMHFRIEVGALWTPVSIYSWWGDRDMLSIIWDKWRHVETIERHLRWIGVNWDKLRWVWVDMRHSMTSQARLGQVLRRITLTTGHVEWCWDELMTIEEDNRHESSKMRRLLWVRHICFKLRDINWWQHDELRHLELICDECRRIRNVRDELKRSCTRFTMNSRHLRRVGGVYTTFITS